MGAIRFILFLPFRIVFFPFRMLANMTRSRQELDYRRMRRGMKRKVGKMESKIDDERLSPQDREKLSKNLEEARGQLYNTKKWRKNQRVLERDPDNMGRFRRAKRYEKRMRKSNLNIR